MKKQTTGVQVPLPSAFIGCMELARPYLESKEEIPDDLMAQLIKGKLIHIKGVEIEKELQRIVLFLTLSVINYRIKQKCFLFS